MPTNSDDCLLGDDASEPDGSEDARHRQVLEERLRNYDFESESFLIWDEVCQVLHHKDK